MRPINEGGRIKFGLKAMNQLTVGEIFLDLCETWLLDCRLWTFSYI